MKSISKEVVKRPILELIEEVKAKISVLEGQRRAYYDSCYLHMRQNREKIANIKKELHDLRQTLHDKVTTDPTIISQAFQNRPVEKSGFSSKSCKDAIDEMDFRVSDCMKRLNHVRFLTLRKTKRVTHLVEEYKRLENEKQYGHSSSYGNPVVKKSAQIMRDMENRCDKLMLKTRECDFIQKTYQQIYEQLYAEQVRSNHILDQFEIDIRRCRAEKTDLITIHHDAKRGEQRTIAELQEVENYVHTDRKRREIELVRMKKIAEENSMDNDRCDKKAMKDMETDQTDVQISDESDEGNISVETSSYNSFEDNFQKLKNITGISNVDHVVNKFENQLHVKNNLVNLINTMEESVNEKREKRADQQQQLKQLKARLEAHTNEVQKQSNIKEMDVKNKCKEVDKTSTEFRFTSEFVSEAKFGLEHMLEKLIHVKTKRTDNPCDKPKSAEEYMFDLFRRIKSKLHVLMASLLPYNVEELLKKLSTEKKILLFFPSELEASLKKQVPISNSRIIVDHQKDIGDDEESGEDNSETETRQIVKSNASDFIEMKTRKKNKRKKKGETKK